MGSCERGRGNLHSTEGFRRDLSMLSGEVTRLTGRLGTGVAGWDFTALVRVKVGTGGGTVTILGNGLLVDVVDW